MRVDKEKLSLLMSEYYSLCKNTKAEKDYEQAVYLESTLRDVVLTGLEFVDEGILEQILNQKSLKSAEDKKLIAGYKMKIFHLSKKHRELKEKYTEDMMGIEKYEDENKLIDIKSVISGKQGNIIDEIRSVLEE